MTKLGDCFTKKKLHNTENSTLNHKNVDSVDPEESCIHTYIHFQIQNRYFLLPEADHVFLLSLLRKRKFDIPIFLALRFQTIYYVISEETKSIDYQKQKTNGADADDIFLRKKIFWSIKKIAAKKQKFRLITSCD